MNKNKYSTKEKTTISSRKPRQIQISHRAVMRAQSSIRTPKQIEHSYRTTPSRNISPPPPIPSYLPKTAKKDQLKPMKSHVLLNNKELIELRESLFKDCNLAPIQTQKLNLLSGHLREYSQYCGLQRRYPEAKKATQLYKEITSELSKRSVIPINLSKEFNSFEIKKEEEIDRFTFEIIEFDEETELKREKMKKKQDQEFNEFQKQWKEVMPERYRKVSPQLLSLMTQEKKCARCGEFDKAELLKKEVDERIQSEMEVAQTQLNLDYQEAKGKFFENQAKEQESFEKVRNHLRDVMIARHKEELSQIANRQCVIESRKCKTSRIDQSKIHSTTAGSVSKVINEIGLDFEGLLPPLNEPTDEKISENPKKIDTFKINHKKSNNQNYIKNAQDSFFQTQDVIGKFIDSCSYSNDSSELNNKDSYENSIKNEFLAEKGSINKANENSEPNDKNDSLEPFHFAQHFSNKLFALNQENIFNEEEDSDALNDQTNFNHADEKNTKESNEIPVELMNKKEILFLDKEDNVEPNIEEKEYSFSFYDENE